VNLLARLARVSSPTTTAGHSTARAPAALPRRLAALFYDSLLLCGLLFLFTFAIVALRAGEAVPAGTGWFMLCLAAGSFAFFGWFWTHGGQTLGMRAWRLRIVRADGGDLTWSDAACRYAAAALSLAALGIGFWWSVWDPERRCWHDLLSQTRMLYEAAATAPARTRAS